MRLFRRSQPKPNPYVIAQGVASEYVTENPERDSESWLQSVKFAEKKLEEMRRMNFEGGISAAQGMLNTYLTAYNQALRREGKR